MTLNLNPQNLPLGLGAFSLDPSMDGSVTRFIYNDVTGLVTMAKVITPKTSAKDERSTIELEYVWDPNGSNRKKYTINFHDIENTGLLSLGIERFDLIGESRKTVQQTMGRLNRGQMITGDSTQWRKIKTTLEWHPTDTKTITNADGTTSDYNVFIADLPSDIKSTPIYIDISFSPPNSEGTQPSQLTSETYPGTVLHTHGDIGTGDVGWWYSNSTNVGTAKLTTQLVLYSKVFPGSTYVYVGTSSTTITVPLADNTGTPIAPAQQEIIVTDDTLSYVAGDRVLIYSASTPSVWMAGTVISYAGQTTMVVHITGIQGTGTFSSWGIKPIGNPPTDAESLAKILSYTTYSYFTNQLESLDTNKVVDYEDTMYVDTWATAPDKIIIAGVCELPQGYETTGICLKFDRNGYPMGYLDGQKDTFPTQFFKALEHMYYLNNHPQAIRRGDYMTLNDFARGQRIPVTFKSRRYPVSVDRPFLAPFELEFIALLPLEQAREVPGSGY